MIKIMKKQYLPLFVSFKHYIISCCLSMIVFVSVQNLLQKSGMNILPVYNVWLILKIAVIVFNGNYIRRCTKSEYILWQQSGNENIKNIYHKFSLSKKIKDTLLVTNMITATVLILKIVHLLVINVS